MSNQLIHESSPYLLQHAENPVNWHGWSTELLQVAKTENKPILVSIGYSSCHWCHVMEHESFEDEEVARLMNEHFICIKVDREERPDLDNYYMTALNHMTGRGGWPLNCFALPDGRPFHGGTYYKRHDWMRLLGRVAEEYRANRDKLEQFAQDLENGIRSSSVLGADVETQSESAYERIGQAVSAWKEQFDSRWGGFGSAPKFPMPNNLLFLMRHAERTNDGEIRSFLLNTLDRMSEGGIYDQLGGGFSRYSVDPYWKVPHFEKMLYDNAQLLSVYAWAYKLSRDARYREVIEGTLTWLDSEMRDESGLYFAALDADSEGEEGRFYVWTKDELIATLGDDYGLANDLYLMEERGLWEESKFILHYNHDKQGIADKHALTKNQLKSKERQIERRLLAVRSKRIRPELDSKCLCSWNALLAVGFLDVYDALGNPSALEKARTILSGLYEGYNVANNGILYRSYQSGNWKISGFLEDYAALISANLRMYECSFDVSYVHKAEELLNRTIDGFYSEGERAFLFSHKSQADVAVNSTEYFDTVVPSSNSVMFRNLIWLGRFLSHADYLEKAENLSKRILPKIHKWPGGYSNWMMGLLDLDSEMELVFCGPNALEKRTEFAALFAPEALIAGSETLSDLPLLKGRHSPDKTSIYLCRNKACEMPVEEVNDALLTYRKTLKLDLPT